MKCKRKNQRFFLLHFITNYVQYAFILFSAKFEVIYRCRGNKCTFSFVYLSLPAQFAQNYGAEENRCSGTRRERGPGWGLLPAVGDKRRRRCAAVERRLAQWKRQSLPPPDS